MSLHALACVQLGCSLALAGILWFVQLVHYPLLAQVGQRELPAYVVRNGARTTWVVAPLMLLELASALALWFHPDGAELPRAWLATGLALLALVWLSTFALQVPEHQRLQRGFNQAALQRLVGSNWIRTLGWSLRVPGAWTVLHASETLSNSVLSVQPT